MMKTNWAVMVVMIGEMERECGVLPQFKRCRAKWQGPVALVGEDVVPDQTV